MKKKILFIIASLFLMLGNMVAQSELTCVNETKKAETKVIESKHTLKGKVTYYGTHYTSKRKTASGEHFNKNALTAAHKTLPFGTMVRVINLKNNKVVVVKVNDRGHLKNGVILDVSPAAARILGIIHSGVAPIKVEIL